MRHFAQHTQGDELGQKLNANLKYTHIYARNHVVPRSFQKHVINVFALKPNTLFCNLGVNI